MDQKREMVMEMERIYMKKERKKERIIASKGGRKMMRIAVIKNCLDSRNDDR